MVSVAAYAPVTAAALTLIAAAVLVIWWLVWSCGELRTLADPALPGAARARARSSWASHLVLLVPGIGALLLCDWLRAQRSR